MLFQQIEANKRKTWILFAFFFLLAGLVGAAAGVFVAQGEVSGASLLSGASIALGVAVVYAIFMVSQSSDVVMSMNHAHEIKNVDDNPEFYHIIEDLSLVAQVPMPRVFIIDDDSPNAFATGNSPKNSAVAITTGLLTRLNREEIEGVMAHEMTHVRNWDIRVQTIAIALMSAIAIVADMATRFWFYGGNRRRNNDKGNAAIMIIAGIFLMLAPLLGTIVQLAVSRNREYLADAGAVELTRNPHGLISALQKISQSQPMSKENVSPESASLYFSNPFKKTGELFATHPDMDKRIAALEKL